MTDSTSAPSAAVSAGTNLSYWVAYAAIVTAVLGIHIFARADYFADFDTYVYYLDSLVHFPDASMLYFEAFSNIYLLSAYWLTNSVLPAIVIAHYVLGVIFLVAILRIFPPSEASWQTLLFAFAILGPLLAFVTMRATPAYLLVAIAISHALERRPSAWLFLLAASLFHISSLLAAGPLVLLYYQRHLPRLFWSKQSKVLYVALAVTIVAASTIIPNVRDLIFSVVEMFPVISKYAVYTDVQDEVTSLSHYIFLAFICIFSILFLVFQERRAGQINLYVVTSLSIYILLFFSASPVAAFRQAPFWLIPMIAMFPWNRLGVSGLLGPVFALFCVGLFIFQFDQVYLKPY